MPLPAARFFRTSTFRLSFLYVLIFAVSMVAVLASVYLATRGSMLQLTDETILREMDTLVDDYRRGGTRRLERAIINRLRDDQVGGWVYLLADENYQPIIGNLPAWPVDATRHDEWLRFETIRRSNRYMMRARAEALGRNQILLVGMDIQPAERFTQTMINAALWGVVLTLLLGAGGGYWMSRNMLRRLDVLNRGAERIMRGNLQSRMPIVGSDDEFDRLATTLNNMLQEIERLIASIRSVTTSLAHDLRSPLTRIKGRLELAATRGGTADELRDEMSYVIGETDQLLHTFNSLLSIAEAEGGTARANMKSLDLFEVAEDVADLYQPIAEDKGLTLTLHGAAGAMITGHRQLLLQALLNLVDNAIKYTELGNIQLEVLREAGRVVLKVADNGPGIPPDQRARVLEQFVRLDPARSTRGNGLGLSLVAAIARLHDAELQLGGEQGLEVRVIFQSA